MMRESTKVDIEVDSRINLDGKVNVGDLKIFTNIILNKATCGEVTCS